MNIWIFNHYAIAPGSSGGTRHYDLAKQLVEKGHKVTIFASSFNHQTRKEEHFISENSSMIEKYYDSVRFVWIKTSSYHGNNWRRVLNMLSYTYRGYKHAKRMDDQPDIVIGSLVHPLAAYLGYKISKRFKCKFYFEERDLWPQSLIELGKISPKNPVILLLSQLELFLYRKADKIIVLFDKAVNYVVSKGIDREKVLYLPNGVNMDRYKSSNNAINLPNEITDPFSTTLKNKFIAVYTGTHGLANNLDVILDAANLIDNKDIFFLLVGDGPEKRRLQTRVEDENILNVVFLPPVQKEFIPLILNSVHIGLLPLQDSPVFKWGISPNKMFDYMAAKLPVILLCDLEDTPVDKANGGLVIKNEFSQNLAHTLQEWAVNQSEVKKMGINASKYVIENHSWDKLANVLEDTFK